MKNLFEYVLLLILRLIILVLPFRAVQIFGRSFGTFMYHVVPIRKGLVRSNLRHAFPAMSERELESIALKNFQNIFATFFETFWIQRMSENHVRGLVRIPDTSAIQNLLNQGRGLVMLSGHISNWELIALAVGLISGNPLQIVVKKQHNPFVDRVMNRLRTKFDNTVVDMDHAPREIIKRLREHGIVALLADQSGPEEGLFIDFFGRPTSTHVGPAVFALRTQAPVLMTYALRNTDGTYDVWFEEVETGDLTGSDDDKIRTITERHVAMLEKFVRRFPDQWLWMHKRWKHTDKYLRRKAEEAVS